MSRLLSLARVAAVAAVAVAAAWGADVTGKWSGQMNGPDGGGGMSMTATFKQDGTKLTGTMDGPGGEAMQIEDGKIDGDKISFAISFNGMKVVHEGTVKGDQMTLNIKMEGGPGGDGGPGPIVLKHSK
jgi:hypothetical protein